MAKRLSRSYDELDFDSISNNYNSTKASINLFYSTNNPHYSNYFSTHTTDEITHEKQAKIDEIDKMFCLTLLSTIEAYFKIDYSIRCEKKFKDSLSTQFRGIYKTHGLRINFEDFILKTWRDFTSSSNNIFNELLQIYKYRHWLAHGRYWILKTNVNKYDFNYLFSVAQIIDTELPLHK